MACLYRSQPYANIKCYYQFFLDKRDIYQNKEKNNVRSSSVQFVFCRVNYFAQGVISLDSNYLDVPKPEIQGQFSVFRLQLWKDIGFLTFMS